MREAEIGREIEGLLPHSGPMRLLSRLLSHTRERTICAVDVSDSELFRDADGQVPACVVVEYMAQCVAAHGVLHLELFRDRLAPSESLEVSARILQRIGRLASLQCEVRAAEGELVAEGVLSVFVPDSLPGVPAARS